MSSIQMEGSHLLTPYEAEQKIQSLSCIGIEYVGSAKWMHQARHIEELNMQAHQNAINYSDEFVSDMLVTIDKIPVLIHELLVIEVWKEKILPLVSTQLQNPKLSVPSYLILQHELQLVNLLECTLFHKQACESTKGDALVELVDYCYRKLVYLNTDAHAYVEQISKEKGIKELMNLSEKEELGRKIAEVQFNCALCTLSILRYMTDYITGLEPGIMARILDTHDVIMSLVPLLDSPCWERRRKGKVERYEDNRWIAVSGDEYLRVNKYSAQIWLALNNLVVEPECRKRYKWNSYSMDILANIKKYFNELLFDQLPVLKDLARVADEIILGAGYSAQEVMNSSLILEQIPEIYDALLRKCDFKAIAEKQKNDYFDPIKGEAIKASASHLEAMLKSFEFLASMEDNQKQATDTEKEKKLIKIKIMEKSNETDEWVAQSNFNLKINVKKSPEEIEQPAKDLGINIKGKRWRLKTNVQATQLPADGQIIVNYDGKETSATFSLPAQNNAPDIFWITVGNLGIDGFALQLKSKCKKESESDYKYFPEGGAMTVKLEGEMQFSLNK